MDSVNDNTKSSHDKEHLSCRNYAKDGNNTVKYVTLKKNEEKKHFFPENCILLTLEGASSISFRQNINKLIKPGNMVLLPGNTEVKATAKENTSIMLFYLPLNFSFCDQISLETLSVEVEKKKNNKNIPLHILEGNKHIDNFAKYLLSFWEEGLRCELFFKLKIKELLFLLRNYTTKEDLATFFAPILTNDMGFYALIMKNYKSVKTVKDMAKLTDYSLAGFEKRFKKVFGIPAYQWMRKQLAADLYHDIYHSKKSFTELSRNYGFSSSAHLTNFCKSVFKLTPKAIRKGETKPESE